MNVQGNSYTIVYAIILVVVMATALTITAVSLQPRQDQNIRVEKMQQILLSVHINSDAETAEELFAKVISESYVVDSLGNDKQGVTAFTVDLKKQLALPASERDLPVYKCTLEDGGVKYIIPVRGKGLWGPIWGYVALNADCNTIYGAVFDHKGETPGLGAEISTDWYQARFVGKKLYNNEMKFVSIQVMKAGKADESNPHQVSAISGGTITSKGVEQMLKETIMPYQEFFKKVRE